MELILAITLGALVTGIGYFLVRLERRVDDTNRIVRQELRPNGGTSMFDRIANIEQRLVNGQHRMDSHEVRLHNLERDQD